MFIYISVFVLSILPFLALFKIVAIEHGSSWPGPNYLIGIAYASFFPCWALAATAFFLSADTKSIIGFGLLPIVICASLFSLGVILDKDFS